MTRLVIPKVNYIYGVTYKEQELYENTNLVAGEVYYYLGLFNGHHEFIAMKDEIHEGLMVYVDEDNFYYGNFIELQHKKFEG